MTNKIFLATTAALVLVLAGFGLAGSAASAAPARPASIAQYPPTTEGSNVEGTGVDRNHNGIPDDQEVGAGGTGAGAGAKAGTGANDGSLPRTGTDVAPYVAIGVALIAAGVFAMTTSIRRRSPA